MNDIFKVYDFENEQQWLKGRMNGIGGSDASAVVGIMERLTHKRENGIKRGYWSPNKKQELVDRLAMYEDREEKDRWIPISERLPEDESYILVSFENASMPDIARYEENDEGGTFYPGDDEETYAHYGLIVNAWMPLPEPYKEEQ